MDELERLTERLQEDPDSLVRSSAAAALGDLADSRSVPPLCRALLEDRQRRVRVSAVTALSRIGDRRAVEPLCQALEDSDGHVLRAAAMALSQFGIADPRMMRIMLRIIRYGDAAGQLGAAEWLGQVAGREVLPHLKQRLMPAWRDGERNKEVRGAIRAAIAQIERRAEPIPAPAPAATGSEMTPAASPTGNGDEVTPAAAPTND